MKEIDNYQDHRAFIYQQKFIGKPIDEKLLFANPGYRGLQVLPYPKHVKELITKISNEASKTMSDFDHIIYQGMETRAFRDHIEYMKTQEMFANPQKKLQK